MILKHFIENYNICKCCKEVMDNFFIVPSWRTKINKKIGINNLITLRVGEDECYEEILFNLDSNRMTRNVYNPNQYTMIFLTNLYFKFECQVCDYSVTTEAIDVGFSENEIIPNISIDQEEMLFSLPGENLVVTYIFQHKLIVITSSIKGAIEAFLLDDINIFDDDKSSILKKINKLMLLG